MLTKPLTSLKTCFPTQRVIPLWPESRLSFHMLQSCQDRQPESKSPDRAVSQITYPEIVVFEPEQPNGIGVLLLPGGGYQRVSVDKEGADSANVLNKAGFTVFVMTYRMPNEGHVFGALTPLVDAQRAIRIVRHLPLASNLSSIGVLGFSAGGHVAASLATGFKQRVYPWQDEADDVSARPDFCVLMYPVISMNKEIAHKGSRAALIGFEESENSVVRFSMEQQVSREMPPCFLLHAIDDPSVDVENSVVFWQALRRHGIASEIHLFERGGHGFGIRDSQGLPVENWPVLLTRWLQHTCLEERKYDLHQQ